MVVLVSVGLLAMCGWDDIMAHDNQQNTMEYISPKTTSNYIFVII